MSKKTPPGRKILKVISGGRVTLPLDWREKWSIEVGDSMLLEWNGDGKPVLRVYPMKSREDIL